MNQCCTCKYFTEVPYEVPYGVCTHPKIAVRNAVTGTLDGVMLQADPFVDLYVGPQFGCIHHEEK